MNTNELINHLQDPEAPVKEIIPWQITANFEVLVAVNKTETPPKIYSYDYQYGRSCKSYGAALPGIDLIDVGDQERRSALFNPGGFSIFQHRLTVDEAEAKLAKIIGLDEMTLENQKVSKVR